ncbi:MAG: RHS repeat-associated core domain-containing protein [bacterium]|nr:RHS repeat-associated core domain-containing protein [bacterium]
MAMYHADGSTAYYSHMPDCRLLCTNESVSVGADRADVVRTYDDRSLCASAPLRETIPHYDADGNPVSFGAWSYTYDAASQLVSVSSNGVLLVTNQYDCRRRRVKKITPDATHTFLYDDWNLIRERVDYTNGVTDEFNYYWGRDLFGTVQGAGGVGGLLYVKRNGVIYVPHVDANGNILRYTDTAGNIVAEYIYDAFGRTISQSGTLADVFRHRFSSKYFDVETGLYYYGYRFYSSKLCRWVTRDIRGEDASLNLYLPCDNKLPFLVDPLGDTVYVITDSTPSRKQSITVRRGGSVIAPRGVTKLTGSLKFVCVSGCKIKTKGVIQLWIELLNEDDPKWQEHYSRYSGNNVTSESQNTLNHELDHFNTWKAFLDFVRTANAYDGKKVSNCAELVGRLNATYERYKSITSAHSLKFDQPGWNQGGQYSRHPLETSTFKWE